MGYRTRKPTPNEPEVPRSNPWGTSDDIFHLLNMSAVCCCHCSCVVSLAHVKVVGKHVFCPDHTELECKQKGHANAYDFIEHNNLA